MSEKLGQVSDWLLLSTGAVMAIAGLYMLLDAVG
jgi:hypothetical protein